MTSQFTYNKFVSDFCSYDSKSNNVQTRMILIKIRRWFLVNYKSQSWNEGDCNRWRQNWCSLSKHVKLQISNILGCQLETEKEKDWNIDGMTSSKLTATVDPFLPIPPLRIMAVVLLKMKISRPNAVRIGIYFNSTCNQGI